MTHTDLGSRILKVDHAGEFGAIAIYIGQIFMARMFARDLVSELVEFRNHERGHRAIFAAELKRRGRPRCRSYALCGMGGFVLGLASGLMGRAAISVTTVAVERVVLRHLREQVIQLRGVDDDAVAAISTIVAEEQMHHDQASTHVPVMRAWHRMLAAVVSAATEWIIWLGMKL